MEDEPFGDFRARRDAWRALATLVALVVCGVAVGALVRPLFGLTVFVIAGPLLRRRFRAQVRTDIEPGPSSVPCPACSSVQTERRSAERSATIELVCNACEHRWGARGVAATALLGRGG